MSNYSVCPRSIGLTAGLCLSVFMPSANADENLLGYVTGAETLPENAQ